jgi:hypothetical protein
VRVNTQWKHRDIKPLILLPLYEALLCLCLILANPNWANGMNDCDRQESKSDIIISADTVVVIDGHILEKPSCMLFIYHTDLCRKPNRLLLGLIHTIDD